MIRRSTTISSEKEFWSQVEKTEDCWIWTGLQNEALQYGIIFDLDGICWGVHRYSYKLCYGDIPKSFNNGRKAFILHRCNNKLCVNPDHLYLGTQSDNMRDHYRSKGLIVPSEFIDPIRSMKRDGMTYDAIGDILGVSYSTIFRVVKGKGMYGN